MRQRIRLREDEKKAKRAALVDGARVLGPRSVYRSEFVELARMCCLAFGATDDQLSAFFAIDQSTLGDWKIAHPEFRAALSESKPQADARVVASLFQRALGYTATVEEVHTDREGNTRIIQIQKHIPADVGACAFWLKNRMDWRDRPEVQINLAQSIKIESLSDSQLESLISRLQESMNG